MTFYQTYKKTIITSLLGVVIVGVLPAMSWAVRAWADDRYVQHEAIQAIQEENEQETLMRDISDIDDTLFEISQDIVEAADEDDPELKAKLNARKEYYENKKDAKQQLLED